MMHLNGVWVLSRCGVLSSLGNIVSNMELEEADMQ